MANDKQSRQQFSERAQTSSGSAQQGEWQPSQRAQQSGYSAESQTPSSSREVARRVDPGAYTVFGPFSMMRKLTEDIDRMFENFGMGRNFFPTDFWQRAREGVIPEWSPRIETCEKEGKLCISADLPGVKKEDLNVNITEDAVTIEGERKQGRSSNEGGYYQSERSYGSFYRSIPLPEGIDPASATAEFKDGVLQIELPAPERKSRARKLEIRG